MIPGKADREAQERFLEAYDEIEKNDGKDDPIYLTHPQHNPVLAGGWIKRGEEQEIPTNTGRRRVNIKRKSSITDIMKRSMNSEKRVRHSSRIRTKKQS